MEPCQDEIPNEHLLYGGNKFVVEIHCLIWLGAPGLGWWDLNFIIQKKGF